MKEKDFKDLLTSINQARWIHRTNKILKELKFWVGWLTIIFFGSIGFILLINYVFACRINY